MSILIKALQKDYGEGEIIISSEVSCLTSKGLNDDNTWHNTPVFQSDMLFFLQLSVCHVTMSWRYDTSFFSDIQRRILVYYNLL